MSIGVLGIAANFGIDATFLITLGPHQSFARSTSESIAEIILNKRFKTFCRKML